MKRLHKTVSLSLCLLLFSWCGTCYPASAFNRLAPSMTEFKARFVTSNNKHLPYMIAGTTAATAAWIAFYLRQRSLLEKIKEPYSNLYVIYHFNTQLDKQQKINKILEKIYGMTPLEFYRPILLAQQHLSPNDPIIPFPTSYPVVTFVETLDKNIQLLKNMQSFPFGSNVGAFLLLGLRKDIHTTLAWLQTLSKTLKETAEYKNETKLIHEPNKHQILLDMVTNYEIAQSQGKASVAQ